MKKLIKSIFDFLGFEIKRKYFSFSDLEKYLLPNGYRFSAIRLNNNNIFSGTIFFADTLFLKKNKFNI